MYKYIGLLLLAGCAAAPQERTDVFLAEEAQVVKTCLAPYKHLSILDKLEADPKTGRSPFYNGAICYSAQIEQVVQSTNYQHSYNVKHFAEYLVKLAGARDKGQIDKPTTIAHYTQASALFRKALVNQDAAMATVERKELASRLSIFLGALSSLAVEQERQRLARRPTNCFVTGVYQTTGVTCL